MSQIRFDGKVVIVTGAGAGIGKKYALFFASRGAKVVVNDLGGSVQGQGASSKAADTVVQEIKAAGGSAVANYDSVEFGDKIVKTAMDAFGRVDILINNAGILKDIAFQNMSEADWNIVLKVHLQGTFAVSRAAWNIMRNQNFGRIINTASGSGLYGNFGQANYSAAKLGIHGLTSTLAKEGERRNIRVNTIAPVAATRMTETVLNKEVLAYLDADNIVPLVAYLCSEENQETGSIFELGGGYVAKVRFQRSQGALFDMPFTPEDVRARFGEICDYSKENEYPTTNSDAFPHIMENVERIKSKPKATPAPAQTQTTQAAAPQSSGPALKSDKIFAMMNNYLTQGHGKDIVASLQATYTFEITPKKGAPVAKSFIIDLKNGTGKVFEGKQTTDSTFTMVDDDFEDVCLGKLNPQTAFMQGKMKIKGNMKKATAFTPELFPPPTPENFAKFLGGSGATTQAAPAQTTATKTAAPATTTPSSGLKCEAIFKLMDTFLSRGEGKHLVAQLQATYMFEITPKKGAPVAKSYIIDLKNGNGRVYEGKEQVDAIFTMVDEDFEAVCLGKLNPQNAFMQGKMKIKGNMKKATAFTPELFPPPTPENFAKYNSSAAPAGGCPVQKAAAQTAAPAVTESGLKSDRIFAMMAAYMDLGEAEKTVKAVDSIYIFEILQKKGGPVVKKFVIDLKTGKGKVFEGTVSNADATFTMVDEDFEAVCLGKLNPQNAFMQGKMKIKGNMKKATLFTPELFPAPTPENVAKYLKPKL